MSVRGPGTVLFPPRAAEVLALLPIVAALAWWRSATASPYTADAGWLFSAAQRIAGGQVPYRDFQLLSTPLTHYVLAGWFTALEPAYWVARAWAAAHAALLVLLTVLFAARLGLPRAQVALCGVVAACWAPTVMMPMPWYDADAGLLILAAGLAVLYGRPRLAGILCATAFWAKQDLGAGAIAAGVLFASGELLLGAAAGVAGGLVLLALGGALLPFLDLAVLRAIIYKFGAVGAHQHAHFGFVDRSSWLALALFLAAVAAADLALPDRGGVTAETSAADRARTAAAIFAGALLASLVVHRFQGYTTRMACAGAVCAVLCRYLPRRHARALPLILVAAAGVRYWGNMRLESVPLHGRLAGLSAGSAETDQLASRITAGETPRTMNVLAYFAADRLPPHRYLHPEEMWPGEAP